MLYAYALVRELFDKLDFKGTMNVHCKTNRL